MTTLKLYELGPIWADVQGLIEASDGELSEDVEKTLEFFAATLAQKADGICCIIRENEALAEAYRDEAHRLQHAQARHTAIAGRLKKYLLDALVKMEQHRVATERFRVAVCRNPQPSITYNRNADTLPPALQRVFIEADLQAARDWWRRGDTLPEGFTVVEGVHLRIT